MLKSLFGEVWCLNTFRRSLVLISLFGGVWCLNQFSEKFGASLLSAKAHFLDYFKVAVFNQSSTCSWASNCTVTMTEGHNYVPQFPHAKVGTRLSYNTTASFCVTSQSKLQTYSTPTKTWFIHSKNAVNNTKIVVIRKSRSWVYPKPLWYCSHSTITSCKIHCT